MDSGQDTAERQTETASTGQDDEANDDHFLEDHGPVYTRSRARKGEGKREEWVKVKNAQRRLKGEEYIGAHKNLQGKMVYDVKRCARKIRRKCSCRMKTCRGITNDQRKKIFKHFWNTMQTWEQKKSYVRTLVQVKQVKRRRIGSNGERRRLTLVYHLRLPNDVTLTKVCRTMFLNTHDLRASTVRRWVRTHDSNIPEKLTNKRQMTKTHAKGRADVRKFLDQLPKLDSHYCRSRTKKRYLQPDFQSFAALHRTYKEWCKQQHPIVKCVSYQTFIEVVHKQNIGLFQPRKDQCDKCCAYKCGNLSAEEYNLHIEKKDEARDEKDIDKERGNQDVYTMDLEAVLLCPRLQASSLYYKTKLCVHNFTLFHLSSKEAVNYVWHEGEGGLSASEFASIIVHFLEGKIAAGQKQIIIYSDGCTYQNRNSILSNALLHVVKRTGVTITQKYLERGHTQMECDSVHSHVEQWLKNRDIYVPEDYVRAIGQARLTPGPYKTIYLGHDFFKDYSGLDYYKSIRPGSRAGDPVVTDIRCLLYHEQGIFYKLNYSDDLWTMLPQTMNEIDMSEMTKKIKRLYTSSLKIKKEKFVHLQQVKSVMPREHHPFFNSLPHICGDDNIPCRHII